MICLLHSIGCLKLTLHKIMYVISNQTVNFVINVLVHLQIEENSRRLRTGDLGIPANPADR